MNWFYQLQNVDPDTVSAIKADIKVIDPFDDRMQRWRPTNTTHMRGEANTKLLAYLSIGEAEDYREYWQKSWNDGPRPSWLDNENPSWAGNFKVRYWEPDWQRLMKIQVDEIINQGFDGVYLDIIDAYEHFEDSRVSSALDMIEFVIDLAAHARRLRPGFWIVPQNGEGLLLGHWKSKAYIDVINAIGKEDVWYGQIDDGVEVTEEETKAILRDLKPMFAAAKPVLFVEYGLSPRQKAKVRGTIAREPTAAIYFTTRDLDYSSAVE